MTLPTGAAFLIGLVIASWLAVLDRHQWAYYVSALQVERSTKGDKAQ
jgi:hypothetical protein